MASKVYKRNDDREHYRFNGKTKNCNNFGKRLSLNLEIAHETHVFAMINLKKFL